MRMTPWWRNRGETSRASKRLVKLFNVHLGFICLIASLPCLREDGADDTLRAHMTRWCGLWHAAVWLAGVVGLRFCRHERITKSSERVNRQQYTSLLNIKHCLIWDSDMSAAALLNSPGRLEELEPDLILELEREDQSWAASVRLMASW